MIEGSTAANTPPWMPHGCKWNKTRAAEKLGVSYHTPLNRIRAMGMEN